MPVKVPGVIGPVFSPSVTRSAPCTSLLSTLPLRVSRVSEAVPLLSSTACGTSSMMLISSVPVMLSPLLSLTTTVTCSARLLAPSPLAWDSARLRV
ncbi:hypothetical protein D3C85_1124650 [compost metagenome]